MLRNYYSTDSVDNLIEQPNTLVVVSFDGHCQPNNSGEIASGLNSLETNRKEVWQVTDETVSRGRDGRCQWARSDSVICAAIHLSQDECQDIERSTKAAYTELLDVIHQHQYLYPFRFWNYLPAINSGNGDQETYKRFCTGRLDAFDALGIPDSDFPAASALGHHSSGAAIYVFASKIPGQHHRNSLQVNAYQYPREYGISSPSFSRATSINLDKQPLFFISGTASIVGHATTCVGDLSGQLQTTAANIKHLLEHANPDKRQLQSMKVYLRYTPDYARAKQQLEQEFPGIDMIFTEADICRSDLLVEVECFCH